MQREQPLRGSIITDTGRLAEIETLWKRHEGLLWNRVAGQCEASDEIAKTIADAFGVSASDQRLLTGNHLNRMRVKEKSVCFLEGQNSRKNQIVSGSFD